MRRKILSLIITIIIISLVFIIVVWFSDKPFAFRKNKDKKYTMAAIAIRDNVIPFQKLGSRLFTIPYLQKKYDHYAYFTQYSEVDKKEAFKDSLYYFLSKYDSVDIYLLAHTNFYYSWLDTFPKNLLKKIHMVYNTGCGNANQAFIWLTMGASSYIGHIGVKSQSPVFYFFFLRRLIFNKQIVNAVDDANIKTEQFFSTFSFLSDKFKQTDMIEGSKATYYNLLHE
jgi:hypothetical protein